MLHLSVHTFTPVLDGKPRIADVGLLYDPARKTEAHLMQAWRDNIAKQVPELKTRRNYPYHGRADGLTSDLREKFGDSRYLGIELEVRNTLRPGSAIWRKLEATIASLARAYVQPA